MDFCTILPIFCNRIFRKNFSLLWNLENLNAKFHSSYFFSEGKRKKRSICSFRSILLAFTMLKSTANQIAVFQWQLRKLFQQSCKIRRVFQKNMEKATTPLSGLSNRNEVLKKFRASVDASVCINTNFIIFF